MIDLMIWLRITVWQLKIYSMFLLLKPKSYGYIFLLSSKGVVIKAKAKEIDWNNCWDSNSGKINSLENRDGYVLVKLLLFLELADCSSWQLIFISMYNYLEVSISKNVKSIEDPKLSKTKTFMIRNSKMRTEGQTYNFYKSKVYFWHK